MKNLALLINLFLILLVQTNVQGQSKSCCSMSATNEFAMLAGDASFQKAHLSPDPIVFSPTTGVNFTFPTSDGATGNGFMVKSSSKSAKYLFVIHEWWGLNDHIKKETEKMAAELSDVNVIAIDLYDGQVATNADEAGKFMQAVKTERAVSLINGLINYVGPEAQIQTIGWCFGGGWSLQAAILAGKQSKGCVMYYGMPEKDLNKLKTLESPVLGIFASKDGWINKPIVDDFEKQMKSLNKPLTVKWYDADHAFANPSNPSKYDKEAAEDAYKLSMAFIRKNF
ncbi:MAG TPA: dienelactone hydrolase family protein [Bacteroidia bacterium]|nr:dienelactone hydrolase family protein [Bacteroidia bacterium]